MSVAVLPSPAFKTGGSLGGETARKKHGKLPFVVDAEPVELLMSSSVETEIIAEADVATEEAAAQAEHVEWETEEVLSPEDLVDYDEEDDDDAEDSDYVPDGDEEDDELDEDEYLRSLQVELDDNADDVKDLYVNQMLAARDRGDKEDAAWVDRYIQAQEDWKQKHGSSIDEFDLDLRLGAALHDEHAMLDVVDGAATQAFWRVWNGRVAPWLPAALRYRRQEAVLSLLGAVLFVALALGIQFHALLQAPWN